MSEASLDARDVGVVLGREADSEDAQRQQDGLRYHKKGHTFYKERYYKTKTKLSRMRLITVAFAIVLTFVGVRAATVMQENSQLENRISELESMLYERSQR